MLPPAHAQLWVGIAATARRLVAQCTCSRRDVSAAVNGAVAASAARQIAASASLRIALSCASSASCCAGVTCLRAVLPPRSSTHTCSSTAARAASRARRIDPMCCSSCMQSCTCCARCVRSCDFIAPSVSIGRKAPSLAQFTRRERNTPSMSQLLASLLHPLLRWAARQPLMSTVHAAASGARTLQCGGEPACTPWAEWTPFSRCGAKNMTGRFPSPRSFRSVENCEGVGTRAMGCR